MNNDFIQSLRRMFGSRQLKVVVENITLPQDQEEIYKACKPVFDKFKTPEIDPSIDLSALASEVNL